MCVTELGVALGSVACVCKLQLRTPKMRVLRARTSEVGFAHASLGPVD